MLQLTINNYRLRIHRFQLIYKINAEKAFSLHSLAPKDQRTFFVYVTKDMQNLT